MRHGLGVLIVLVVPLLLTAACASRSWTRSIFAKQDAEIDERFLRVEQRTDQHGERLGALGSRVVSLETSLAETAQVAGAARDRAEIALARTDGLRTRHLVGTVHVRFDVNRADLDDRAETALAAVVRELVKHPALTVDLEGFTDPTGSRDHNLRLSLRRVEAVRRYLMARGVESPRIVQASGVGELRDRDLPDEHKRRVSIKLMRMSD